MKKNSSFPPNLSQQKYRAYMITILLRSTYNITCVFHFYLFSLHTSRPVSLVQTSLCRSLMANSIQGHGRAFGCVSIATVLGPEKSLSLSTVPSGTQIGLHYRLTRPQPRLVANKQPNKKQPAMSPVFVPKKEKKLFCSVKKKTRLQTILLQTECNRRTLVNDIAKQCNVFLGLTSGNKKTKRTSVWSIMLMACKYIYCKMSHV